MTTINQTGLVGHKRVVIVGATGMDGGYALRYGELGTTYQGVPDHARHRSAQRLLNSTNLGLGEVAFLLGFEEVNSFMRAFHVWEGTTPAKWRARADSHRAGRQRRRPLRSRLLRTSSTVS